MKYKLAFFSEGSDLLKTMEETRNKLVADGFESLVLAVVIISIIFLLVGFWRIKYTARKMTRQIIYLYETLEDILQNNSKTKKVELSFKPSS